MKFGLRECKNKNKFTHKAECDGKKSGKVLRPGFDQQFLRNGKERF